MNITPPPSGDDTEDITQGLSNLSVTPQQVGELNNPHKLFLSVQNVAHEKSQDKNKWLGTAFEKLVGLSSDAVGKMGENYVAEMFRKYFPEADAHIDGSETKMRGGGHGDGTVKGWWVEVKTAKQGTANTSFQHEFSATPWKADYVMFLNISHSGNNLLIYITIFKNFTETFWKDAGTDSNIKFAPYFPSRSCTWRQKEGHFKLTTTIEINDKGCEKGCTYKIDPHDEEGGTFREFVNFNIPVPKSEGLLRPPDVTLKVEEEVQSGDSMTVPELKKRAKELKITGVSKLKKAELVEAIAQVERELIINKNTQGAPKE